MTRTLIVSLILALLLPLSGCSEDPNAKANALYVDIMLLDREMREEADSYSEAFASYKKERTSLDTIFFQYKGSNIAVTLLSGQTRISGLTLSEFRELEPALQIMADAEEDPLSCALLLAEANDWGQSYRRAEALTTIAGGYLKSGRTERATALLPKAVRALDLATDQERTSYGFQTALALIAEKYAEARLFADALGTAQSMAGQDTVQSETLGRALEHVAIHYADTANLNEARKTAANIENMHARAHGLASVSVKYAEAGQFEDAREIAETINNPYYRMEALAAIAAEYADSGKGDEANQLLSKVLKANETNDDAISNAMIAAQCARMGETETAAKLLLHALQMVEEIQDSQKKASELNEIASIFSKLDLNEQAKQLLSAALAKAQSIEEPRDRVQALYEIAVTYADAGLEEQTTRALQQALAASETVPDKREQHWRFARIAEHYATAGELLRSPELFADALKTLQLVKNGDEKALALARIAAEYAAAGLRPSTQEVRLLSEMLRGEYPLNEFWDTKAHPLSVDEETCIAVPSEPEADISLVPSSPLGNSGPRINALSGT